jgi:hypothetical protein
MRWGLLLILISLTGCSGFTLQWKDDRPLLQSKDKQFKCYNKSCCVLSREIIVLCTEPSSNNVMFNLVLKSDN